MTTLRQRVLSLMVIITAVILFWEVYQVFFQRANADTLAPSTTSTAQSASLEALASKSMPPLSTSAYDKSQDNNATANLSIASANQSEYLQMVNAYQVAQLQRLLAEQKAAIAMAEVNAAKANAEMDKYLGNGSTLNIDGSKIKNSASDHYAVKFVDYQNEKWTALLEKNGQAVEVHLGDTLPDGQKVLAINNSGVSIKSDVGDVTEVGFGTTNT